MQHSTRQYVCTVNQNTPADCIPFSPSSTKLTVGGTLGKRLGMSAGWSSESEDPRDETADTGRVRPVEGRDLAAVEGRGLLSPGRALLPPPSSSDRPSIRLVADLSRTADPFRDNALLMEYPSELSTNTRFIVFLFEAMEIK